MESALISSLTMHSESNASVYPEPVRVEAALPGAGLAVGERLKARYGETPEAQRRDYSKRYFSLRRRWFDIVALPSKRVGV
jgi:hypothetical protein